ncbi:hypothetical protein PE066_14005 [Ramlibacter tataouinensis]|uniref:hypothetical protein n=1 Tax=Ramlibacter tataouinensis TaxID=94132 RepID=UPI0022F3D65B|nr:hypothetical protein [Ramlibacter tataouinensis]WBY00577.1 hypothetical protein PE066_14005 [Ramlibacter tataouinensis]
MDDQSPLDALGEWATELDRLCSFVHDNAVLEPWLRGTFPRIMALVSKRRVAQFMAGIRRAHDKGLIESSYSRRLAQRAG